MYSSDENSFDAKDLAKFAGLKEHPNATQARLEASGEWEAAGQRYRQELTDAARRLSKNPERDAWLAVQKLWQPPADAVPISELPSQSATSRELANQQNNEDPSNQPGSRPPRPNAEEQERFRKIDDDIANGLIQFDPLDDVFWVYLHLDDYQVRANDAPSRGAWSQLFYARNNRVEFMKTTWPKASGELKKRPIQQQAWRCSDEEKLSIEQLREEIRTAVKASQKMRLEDY